ncbi:MAG: hypothetical protein F6J90_19455 [Moorea sp. SIOASIH]|nr:hypothetical protein [Moorena sp. SIOASIH]NEO89755.1 hypothetical protein [Moorena sp. SIO3G5]
MPNRTSADNHLILSVSIIEEQRTITKKYGSRTRPASSERGGKTTRGVLTAVKRPF